MDKVLSVQEATSSMTFTPLRAVGSLLGLYVADVQRLQRQVAGRRFRPDDMRQFFGLRFPSRLESLAHAPPYEQSDEACLHDQAKVRCRQLSCRSLWMFPDRLQDIGSSSEGCSD